MSGEKIFAIIIMVGSCWFCAAIFCGIAFWALKRKDPMHFYSGTTVDPGTVSDIPAYNREVARMWFVYSGFFWLSGIAAFFRMMAAVIIMSLACIPGIFLLVGCYNRIYKKYKI